MGCFNTFYTFSNLFVSVEGRNWEWFVYLTVKEFNDVVLNGLRETWHSHGCWFKIYGPEREKEEEEESLHYVRQQAQRLAQSKMGR